MIHPTLYPFIAPYRGPKYGEEFNKWFKSVVHDLETAKKQCNELSSLDTDTALSFIRENNGCNNKLNDIKQRAKNLYKSL